LQGNTILFLEDKDAQLMARVTAGDLSAFEELVVCYRAAAWALAFHYLADPTEAEDVVQEAFLRLLKSASRYQPTAAFRTYFSRIVVRLCLDFRLKKHPVYCEVIPESTDLVNDPESALNKKESSTELKRALAALPPTQRMAFLLRHVEGFTYSEIAEAMNISTKAVDSLLQRGRQSLRTRLHLTAK
jgi:RNA polymerase sigma-70 factor (ECF subfamily)